MRKQSSGCHSGQCWLMLARYVLSFIVDVKKLVMDSVSAAKLECAVPPCASVKEAVSIMKMMINDQIHLTVCYCFECTARYNFATDCISFVKKC